MKKLTKKCRGCGEQYIKQAIHSSERRYCSEICKQKYLKEYNKKLRKKRKDENNIDWQCHRIFEQYKQRSPKRNLTFELTEEFFKKNFQANCYFCGDKLHTVGFDRLDNSIGYTIENSAPCCKECNFMKHSQTELDFIEKCKKIINNHV